VPGELCDVLSGVTEIDGTRPGHHTENIKRNQHAHGMQILAGFGDEVSDDFASRPVRMILLICESVIHLVALGREANVVKLNFIHTGAGHQLRQVEVVLLNLGVRGIEPGQFAVLEPGLAGAVRPNRETRISLGQVGITKQSDACNAVQLQRVQVMRELGKIPDRDSFA